MPVESRTEKPAAAQEVTFRIEWLGLAIARFGLLDVFGQICPKFSLVRDSGVTIEP